MPKIYSAKTILKALKKAGFEKVSQEGSHIKLRGIREGKMTTVIVPNYREIARGTFGSILRQADMTHIEFESYL